MQHGRNHLLAYTGFLHRYLSHPIVKNAIALYWIQFAEYALPMISVPYLARVLLPAGWGLVVFAQSFSGWLGLVLEYGFGFSATREVARNRDDPERGAEVAAGVLGAGVLLMSGALLASTVALYAVPTFRIYPIYLWLAFAIAVTQGVRPMWYFQGVERMQFPALLNVAGRLVVTGGIFLWVKSEADGWKVLVLQAVSGAVISGVILFEMYKKVPWRRPTMAQSYGALRMGWTVFLSRSAVSLYTLANTFILGLFQNTQQVAFYGGAERVNRMVLGLLQPVSQALYPRMSHLAVKSRSGAEAMARVGLMAFGAFGVIMCVVCAVLAPWIVRILLGPKYLPVIGVFRVMALLFPLIAVSNLLGVQWMLPFGMDRLVTRILLCAGVLNVSLAIYTAPRFGPIGMAWSVTTAEAFVTAGMWIALYRKGHRFWSTKPSAPATATPENAG
jgi:polysaccharide transporter, PST family